MTSFEDITISSRKPFVDAFRGVVVGSGKAGSKLVPFAGAGLLRIERLISRTASRATGAATEEVRAASRAAFSLCLSSSFP